jgi:hypothetical protein
MQSLQEAVRAHVDELRAINAQTGMSQNALLGSLSKTGCHAPSYGDMSQPHNVSSDGSGAIHLCPWHTCAATRHG